MICVGNANDVDGLANILRFRVSFLLMKYLGLCCELYLRPKSVLDEKIEPWLAGWKRVYLAKGGMISLIKSYPI